MFSSVQLRLGQNMSSAEQKHFWNFIRPILICVLFATPVFLHANEPGCCTDGLGTNDSLPNLDECKKMKFPNGEMIQITPKVVLNSSVESKCLEGKGPMGIQPGHRVCRFPDCYSSPCKNGQCVETLSGYYCNCSTGLHGKNCDEDDIDPPIVSGCPASQTYTVPVDTPTHSFTWSDPIATDTSGIASIIPDHPSGVNVSASRPLRVTYTVTDRSGLTDTSCTFTLTVYLSDTDPPVVNGCPGNQTYTAPVGGPSTHQFTWSYPTATDAAGIASITPDHTSPATVSVGSPLTVTYTVTDNSGLTNTNCSFVLMVEQADLVHPKDCSEIHSAGVNTSGVYSVYFANKSTSVYCDMETAGGGWTVFQRRQDGSVDFYRNWTEYKHGFGNVSSEHWLGNDNIHLLSSQKTYELRVDLEDFEGETRYAQYNNFIVADESDKYRLTVGVYSGNAGDGLEFHNDHSFTTSDRNNGFGFTQNLAIVYMGAWWYNSGHRANLNGQYLKGNTTEYGDGLIIHNGHAFTTMDRDNDVDSTRNCAIVYQGAWWYRSGHWANLNGQYLNGTTTQYAKGVTWYLWLGNYYSLEKTVMKIHAV